MKLLELFCRGQEYKTRIEQSRTRLYRTAYAWCHDATLADDLTQETLEKALKKHDQVRDPAALEAWLFSILNNCWRDHFRRTKNMLDIDDVALEHPDTPELEHQQHQIVHEVRAAVARLPVGQRQVLTLVDLEDCSYLDVAQILDIPVGTVMSRLCRARRALKELLLDSDLVPHEAAAPVVQRLRRIK